MKRKWKSVIFSVFVVFFIMDLTVGAPVLADDLEFIDRDEMKEIWNEMQSIDVSITHDEDPNSIYPYELGVVSENMLEKALLSTNFVRLLAGLPGDVVLDEDLNDSAQHGALVLAAIGELTHYPSQPEDMSDEMYDRGYGSTSSSNLSVGRRDLAHNVLNGYMPDIGRNMDRVGHRRWILHPPLKKVGFGLVDSYGAMQVFDRSRGQSFNYDHITWPAGEFPSELFGGNHPWSVSLNLEHYQRPNAKDIEVTITRESDGEKWVMNHEDSEITSSEAYFTVDHGNYGLNNAIIFRPEGISSYEGVYTVDVKGVKSRNGAEETLTFDVDFFELNEHYYDGEVEEISLLLTLTTPGRIVVDGEIDYLQHGERPFVESNRTMVPLRIVSEHLRKDVRWDGNTREITITDDEIKITMKAGENEAIVNGTSVGMDTAPEIRKGVTFVPLRFVSEMLGASVTWSQADKSAEIKQEIVH
ncbi:stalk domain-containing protein [Desertibacillus haloalkaliphilus]|uniref:stalk domain-containing protein n=1 Tax=Desertibacillus haloalkaliphilus TaxID=1328930 RepID=UPI001C277467|nr:stalk domain-containing protein [Desertibacillus haloalkaliphilus]MBU8906527.1 hypothetical protein [Desertibacillus haloalkaliphilus]